MTNVAPPPARAFERRLPPSAPVLAECRQLLDLDPARPDSLPFGVDDVTAGSENELQVAILGSASTVDLPLTIRESNYLANVARRAVAGETSARALSRLERFLDDNREGVWENSWVRFPRRVLSPAADMVFDHDLRVSKSDPSSRYRDDIAQFCFEQGGEALVRVPVSYLLKLALVDAISASTPVERAIEQTGMRLAGHLLNDNTSPETISFHIVRMSAENSQGRAVAAEAAKRFLLCNLLLEYANERFNLNDSGQKATLFFSPHPPVRQKELNELIADSFYRELFMSPCLSGWDRGDEKRNYMTLCHQVLSRSHLNAVAKLREAGIITRGLVVLPNTSNISLANNGTHVSLGSRKLASALSDPASGFTPAHEKLLGDLVIKIVEHFLPLFVTVYSAAPYRVSFADFHPERMLGFLPHELDFTHLRMFWRRWRGKARNRLLGSPISPLGPAWMDQTLSRVLRLHGDFLPDFRLVDYPVALMSTERSPALDGRPGNGERLKRDLDAMGVFDARMSLYLPYKLRELGVSGFSGFEGRFHSLFPGFGQDMAEAVNLQRMVTALAFRYVAEGRYGHYHIPDQPQVESERRQVLFAAAVGVPTFFVRTSTPNQLLLDILATTKGVRASGRYPGYLRVPLDAYRAALVEKLRADAAELIDQLGMEETVEGLAARLEDPLSRSASGRLTGEILESAGARSPFQMRADAFNTAAERFYRVKLRRCHLEEALEFLEEDLRELDSGADLPQGVREALAGIAGAQGAAKFVAGAREGLLAGRLPLRVWTGLIHLMLLVESAADNGGV